MHNTKEIAMNNRLPAAKNKHLAGEVANEETSAAATGEDNCSGHGHEGCCGNHRQEGSSRKPGAGCCGH
jgi:hypothetical protein